MQALIVKKSNCLSDHHVLRAFTVFFVYFGGSGFIVALLPLQPVFVFVYPLHLSEIAFLIFGCGILNVIVIKYFLFYSIYIF